MSDSGEAIGAFLVVGLLSESVSSMWHKTISEVTALGSVDQVGVITEDTITALASIGLDTGAVVIVAKGDVTGLGGGAGLGGVVTDSFLDCM